MLIFIGTMLSLVYIFVQGGQGTAYNDVYYGVNGPQNRAGTTVNVDAAMVVSYIADGEWLTYSVASAAAGIYEVSYSLSAAPPAPVKVAMFLTREASCAGAQTGLYSSAAFSTGSYTAFQSAAASSTITLPSGTSMLRLCILSASYLQMASMTLTPVVSRPFEGIPATLPGVVTATRFDTGGQGVAYNEVVVSGQPRVRAGELVSGDSVALGYLATGEWLRYSVQVAAAGNYAMEYLLAGNMAVTFQNRLNSRC
jgi:Carbohydrate binding module (family 6)